MVVFEVGDIVKINSREMFGRVLEIFPAKTKIMTEEGEKTFPHAMLEKVVTPDLKVLVLHPEQRLFRDYCAKYELSNPLSARYFRFLAEELMALVGWYPGDGSWRFIDTSLVASNLVIRVPAGKTSNIFHLSCYKDTIRVEIEVSKGCPPELVSCFPRKGVYFGGDRKVISSEELNEGYIRKYLEDLKTIYSYNLDPKNSAE